MNHLDDIRAHRDRVQIAVDGLRHAAHDVVSRKGEPLEDVCDIFTSSLDNYPDLDGDPDVNHLAGWLAGFAEGLGLDVPRLIEITGVETAVYARPDGEALYTPATAPAERGA